ncbi:type II toxin-antitoxin system HicA family toxin [Microvirga sp. 2MCAF38]|uniref:type II toxin-antitoxin system HicA family toxin n=1 Tax=Microvirga sp. 2MCAF38 TaxID=3232989 RepID=UPI003F97B8AD
MNDFAPAVRRILREQGFEFLRQGRGDHEIWHNATSGRKVVVDGTIKSRHTANGILKQARLSKAF